MNLPSIIIILLISTCFLSSCEKEVSFHFNETPPKLVVEGKIEQGQYPLVQLTQSLSFLGVKNINHPNTLFIHDAQVIISDGINSIELTEYYNITNPQLPLFYYYSVDTSIVEDQHFKGIIGKTYYLSITIDGASYHAKTSIPAPKPLDSLWTVIPPQNNKHPLPENVFLLYVRYSDPDTIGNRYRIFTRTNNEPYYPSLPSVYSDELANGAIADVAITPGRMPGDTTNSEWQRYFHLGDTIKIKWSAIDKATYDFYNTLEFGALSVGNPFAGPTSIISNIKGKNVLGIWAGLGTVEHEIIIAPPHEAE